MTDKLPAAARRKIADIEQSADDAEALVRSALAAIDGAQRRLADLTNLQASNSDKVAPERIEAVEAEIARLRNIVQTRQARSASDRQVLTQIRAWLNLTPPVGMAPVVAARPEAGESIAAAVERVRQEIASLKNELAALRAAPLTTEELKRRASDLVDDLVERGCPIIRSERGTFEVAWRQPGATIPAMTPQDVAAFMAWFDPDRLLERLTDEIDDAEGVSAAERARREPELEARILAAERAEEALIEQTSEVARRPDASPAAILGVVCASLAAQAA